MGFNSGFKGLKFEMRAIIQGIIPQIFLISMLLDAAFYSRTFYRLNSIKRGENYLHISGREISLKIFA